MVDEIQQRSAMEEKLFILHNRFFLEVLENCQLMTMNDTIFVRKINLDT